ncbi:MAG: hypothetical protein RL708_2718, partial [Bacteroidota bacterium]
MKKNTSCLLLIFLSLLSIQLSTAQSINNWKIKTNSEFSKLISRPDKKTIPKKYKVLSLDFKSLKTNLKSASRRNANNKLATSLLLDFPNDDGSMETYSIEKTSVLHPDLEAKYPEIQSYYGISKKNPLNKIYISVSPAGFTGLITGNKTIYIDPYNKTDVTNYIVYDRKDCDRNPDDAFICNTDINEIESKSIPNTGKIKNATDAKLRTYDLAVACTSEYTAYYGNTVAGALAAINTTITRVNSVYKRDLGIQFQIVASNDRLIYRNNVNIDATPDPDPYDNYDGSQMLGVNTSNITGLIGSANYDIGHVFSTGGGGIAGIAPCAALVTSGGVDTGGKGKGVTGIVTPQFDPFDIDYVCHEMGHQFGAGHTQNNSCQFSAPSGLEPGSASTIMGYAGICTPNVQGNSDAYFHAISIQQMTAVIAGNTCDTEATIVNSEPVITAVPDYTIPKSTPFTLTGIASDADGDTMTYCWEQMDASTTGLTATPTSTSTTRPNFRSFFPTTSPSRTFPNLNAIISNTTPTWEVLPSVARPLNFRLTVRDNNPLGGQSNQDNVLVTVGTAGPFAVTSPNTSTIWYVGESKTITWDVLSTNTATYSVNVNIKLSIDGGLTYPITLLAGTPNDGSQAITVPNNIGTTNRIKVEAAANIFFDISNANFEIKANTFDLTTTQQTVSVCKPSNAVYTINYTPSPTFTETVTFSAVGLPVGATATFSPTTRNTAGTVTMTLSNIGSVATGISNFNFNGTSTNANINLPVTLKVFDNNIGNTNLISPSNGATNQQTSVLLQWNGLANASAYVVEISPNPNFSTITETATVTTNSYQTLSLTSGSINFWRIKPINTCVNGTASETFTFQIASDFCKTYSNVTFENSDSTWDIGSTNAVIAKINIPDNTIISDVNFYMKATHSQIGDIKMQFSGPTGIFAEIYNRDCTGANFDVTFDDSGTNLTCGNVDPLTTAALEGIQKASQSLSKFNGTSSLGTWTLLATDRFAATAGGTFNQFSITICGKLQIVNNIALLNSTFNIPIGTTSTITQAKLEATQPTATAIQLIYTLSQIPSNGILKLNGTTLAIGNTFTQADINNNLISYTNNGINTNADSFKFSINGINSAFLGGQTVNINICSPTIPTFAAVPAICAGASLSALPTTSTNGVTGTWAPALNNAATTLYTFTPTAGLCATTATLTITVNPNTTPTFAAVPAICAGASLSALPTTSTNGVT